MLIARRSIRKPTPTCSNHYSSAANWESDWYLKAPDSLVLAPQEQREQNGRDALRFRGGATGDLGESRRGERAGRRRRLQRGERAGVRGVRA